MSQIILSNVTKKYGDRVILDNFSLTISENEFLIITGPSGRGKSTILNIIGMLDSFDSGSLQINSYINPKITQKAGVDLLRNTISYLFQNYGLVEEQSVEYNLKMATHFKGISKTEEKNQIRNALERVGLAGFEKKKIYQLSGGEQQRVALARIILKPSDIILADEPTGSLDTQNRDLVMKILRDIHQEGKTIIMVTHDPSVETNATRIVRL